jgi:ATP-binding cassette subfamily B protein
MNLSPTSYLAFLSQYLKPQRKQVGLLAALLFVDIGLQLINPQIIRQFIDTAKTGTIETLTYLALVYMAVAFIQQGLSVWATYVSENVGWMATNAVRGNLARHCLFLDMRFHNNHTPGEMIERIDGDVNALGNFFSQFAIQIVGNLLLVVGILVVLFLENWPTGLGLCVFVMFSFGIAMQLRNIAVPHMKAARQASADMFGFLEERLAGAEDIRASRAVPYVLRRFYELTRGWLQKQIKSAMMINIMVNSQMITWAFGNALALALGAYFYTHNVFTLGTVYLVFHYTTMLLRPIERIAFQLEDLQRATASVERIGELTAIQNQLLPGRGDTLPEGSFPVHFHHVTFGYQPDEPVIKDLHFSLQAGRVLGLLGRTGSGKTTLTRLLFRLYDPDEGRVCLGNTDIRHAHLTTLRSRIAMVTQNVQIFQASVRDNLTLFDPAISDDRMVAALHDLGLTAWFQSLPKGLDTMLAADGLSAGEAQLLAFVRIFLLKNPDLVILDEASSRLDPATEKHLEYAIDRLIAHRTAIVIAHRLETVRRADDILILDNGCLLEYGTRVQLEQNPQSHFARLMRTGIEDLLV